ncbi:MAG: glycosyltransferase family 2 protein, partial [Microgenomates group bacterium]
MSQKNKKVSIIVAAYNEELRIGECLSSLSKQDYGSYEILLTDDGSYDNTVSIAKKFPVKVIKNNHLGTAKSRNKAASQATGEILAFLDADMTFEPNFISKLVLPINNGQSKGTFS